MSEARAPPVSRPRLNPFAYPSETTLRFVLLVIFVLCGSAVLYGNLGPTDQGAVPCTSQVWSELSKLDMSSPANADGNAKVVGRDVNPLLAHCAGSLRPVIAWKLCGICLVIVVATIFYYLYPTWKLRTGRLEPISASEVPEIQRELNSIAETARLAVPLAFVWNPLAGGLPVVFGCRGKYYMALSGSFISQYFYRDKDSFRAIMLHELAHIRNGDVPKTYFTMSLWLAFIVIALAPSLFAFVWRLTALRWSDAAPLLLNSVLWSSVIMLSGLAVLRAREYYADVQASVWDRAPRIDRVLAGLPTPVGEGWRRYLRFHPDPRERLQIVGDPSRLLRLRFADAFAIGIAAWSIVSAVSYLLVPFWPKDAWAALVFYVSIKVAVPAAVFVFAIGAIGIGVWRHAFASLLKGDHSFKGTGWLAAAFVAGSLPGLVMVLAEAALMSFGEQPLPFWIPLTALLLDAVTCIVLLVGCLLVFRWIAEAASAWFEVVLRSRSPRPILLFSVATALILLVATFGLASFVVTLSFMATPWRQEGPNWIYQYGLVAGGPIVIVSMAAWAFPLAASWRRKQVMPAGLAGWVFLDGAAPQIPGQEPVRPGEALWTGIVTGLVFWLAWELLYFRNHLPTGIGETIHSSFEWLFVGTARVFGDRSFLLAASATCFQALAAAIAAGRARRLSAVCGLFAASAAGFIIVAGYYVFFGIGYENSASGLATTSLLMMGLGAMAALPTVVAAAWVTSVARRVFANTAVSPNNAGERQQRPPSWFLLSKGSIAALCVVVGIGMTARIREVVVKTQEVNAYQASAERGDSDAQNKLGNMYARGQAVAQDDAQAIFWWRKAAEQGHADAQYNLANMFFMGRGVAQDDVMAAQWVLRAAEQGHVDAEDGLGTMYALGRGVAKDDSLALHWFREAAERGQADAQNNLGIFYALGRGTPQDDTAAVQWLRKAAAQGHADAQNSLGFMYQHGRALPKDDVLALQWFHRAAEQGHADAQFHVGQIYEKGEVVAKDDEQAVLWFRKAAEKGHADAKAQLQAMCDRGLRVACSP
jgi:TPR repeat protein